MPLILGYGYPKWMVYFIENPVLDSKYGNFGGSPILGGP